MATQCKSLLNDTPITIFFLDTVKRKPGFYFNLIIYLIMN